MASFQPIPTPCPSARPPRRPVWLSVWWHHTSGQSVVETAVVLSLFFFLLFGGLCLWQQMMTRYTTAQAVRAAAFTAATRGGPDGIPLDTPIDLQTVNPAHGAVAAAAQTVIQHGMTTKHGHATLTIRCPLGCTRNAPVVAEMTYQERYWAPVPGCVGVDLTLTASRPLERDAPSP